VKAGLLDPKDAYMTSNDEQSFKELSTRASARLR
jgi:hypothetical protein